ncbi:MutS protein 1 [Lithohypha guttulata]|uniref:DNA mismatch repair protein MSH3 n=1 Tax=Lithohypha guttulata TaxID=1690604 RepID=A0AAN7SVA6_9EURO|nr:MutS protein 1 [Lithohypha guttulata]
MAGFQLQFIGKYLKKLVQELDKKVAICDEYPVYVQGKLQTPIPRRVSRVVTAGTLVNEDFLDQEKNNFLLSIHCNAEQSGHSDQAVAEESKTLGLAWIDVSTGDFFVQTTERATMSSALMRIGAAEVVLSKNVSAHVREEVALSLGLPLERLVMRSAEEDGDATRWTQRLDRPLQETERSQLASQEIAACQQLFDYVDNHLLDLKLKPRPPQRKEEIDTMSIDRSSIRGLELLKTARDGLGKGSLLNTIQRTVTKGGSRLLKERLLYPSVNPGEIKYHLDLVDAFMAASDLHQSIIAHLRQIYDIVRIAQKLVMNRGDAEDLLCLARTIQRMTDMVQLLNSHMNDTTSTGIALRKLTSCFVADKPQQMSIQIRSSIDEQGITDYLTQGQDMIQEELDEATGFTSETVLQTDSPVSLGKASSSPKVNNDFPLVMQRNASTDLGHLHDKLDALNMDKHELQQRLREQLMSPRLVLKFDTKYGHVCSTPRAKGLTEEMLTEIGASLIGNLKTIKTFYLADWTNLGRQIDSVKFDIRQEEQRIFETLRQLVVDNLVPLRQNAAVMHELDLTTSFATLASEENWVRPVIASKPIHNIIGGRHPTVKLGLQAQGQSFVSNDLHLDLKSRAWLITGPNMAGKSTFLRQNALITILAQMGSYVPAEYAEIGIVDKVFSRIGAADDLFRNESTFMVEMLETAHILRDATDKSFVIMDEIGRGTAPEDGAAIAYASLHHLYNINKCRTLFATHFHDMADKTQDWSYLAQHCTDLYEDDSGSFTFIHRLRPGVNRKSHALRVAKMAGLPQSAIDMAQNALDQKPHCQDWNG